MSRDSNVFFTRPFVVFLIAILCTVLWGSAYPAIKTGYFLLDISQNDIASQLLFAGQRFLLSGVFLLFIGKLLGKVIFAMNRRQVFQVSLLGFAQTTFQYIFFYIGLAYTTGMKASILSATGTFFSVILAHFIYQNDKLNYRKSLGCIIGFLGVLIVNFNASLLDFHFKFVGEGFIVLAAFCLAFASIYGKNLSHKMDATLMTAWQLTLGGLFLLSIGYVLGGKSGDFNWISSVLLIYLALLSAVAFALWSILLKYNPVGNIVIFNFLIPIFGSLLSGIFLDENILQWKNLLALVLVSSGIYLVTKKRKNNLKNIP